jgi:uncharacterized protein YgiM (DUF1202 family)
LNARFAHFASALALVAALLLLPLQQAAAKRELLQLFVTEPYLELHTAPGRGFPVTQVVARGEAIDVLKRQTEWFKVRTERGVEGWAHERELAKTVLADGKPFVFPMGDRAGFTAHRWEGGVLLGDYAGATLVSTFAARSLTNNMKVELSVGQFLGNLSNGYLLDLGLTQVIVPEWRISPFITLGTGYQRLEPKVTLALPSKQNSQTAYVGLGARYYLGRRFFLRAEYRHHTVFTDRDSNEVKKEWKAGFAFFY